MVTLIINAGGPSDRNAIELATRDRTWIPNERRRQHSPEALQSPPDTPHGAVVRSIDGRYNCMGMVFASRRTWVDPEHWPLIRVGDGLREITQVDVKIADIVVYVTPRGIAEHVGLVACLPSLSDPTLRVVSKWGALGEYVHDLNALPDMMHVAGNLTPQFFTERP